MTSNNSNPTIATPSELPPSLFELFSIFLKIGAVAFGGYLALVAMVERELTERRALLKNKEVVDGLALATALPGPVAVNVVAYVGFLLRGVSGALVSMAGVIIPSFLLLVALAEVYARYGEVPAVANIFAGFLPAVVAIILSVAYRMARQNISHPIQWAIALTVLIVFASIGGFLTAIGLIIGAAAIGAALFRKPANAAADSGAPHIPARWTVTVIVAGAALFGITVALRFLPYGGVVRELWLSFSGMSLVMFGGGYVFIPMMKEVVVQQHHWLSTKEFADAIALGQVTPGPIMISAAFIGYRVAHLAGALVASVAIFLPSALLMMVLGGLHQRIGQSSWVKAAYQGIRPCIVGLVLSAALLLARSSHADVVALVIFLAALLATVRYKLDTVYVVPAAGLIGFIGYGILAAG